nr:PH domain-containing protein [uncultured Arsenicibacter sp.]
MIRFYSKPGPELVIPLALINGGMLIAFAYDRNWSGIAVIIAVSAFIVHMFLTTWYQLEGNVLRVKCGFFINQTIDIGSIRSVTQTRNPLGAPATSLDRLEIRYNRFDFVLVSPKDKTGFIRGLLHVNPAITVKLKD